ncbi:cyclin-T1-4-like isoform X1 [Tripterygium wilfordii]|uniref:B-like cyclin n=1 Tax=Tripterygium wilfordii TaxID=458696 RepID=A0A7J7CWZ7_TRIWF|nr:cyclin-T1-5-like [Tripterygium wilfordii]KAF5738627.1 cyclin-T1-4-like isoform X1 [Tripterygium wilfordii]
MSLARNYRSQGGTIHDHHWSSFNINSHSNNIGNWSRNNHCNDYRSYDDYQDFFLNGREHVNHVNHVQPPNAMPSSKRRKFSASTWGDGAAGGHYLPSCGTYEAAAPSMCNNSTIQVSLARSNVDTSTSGCGKRDRSKLEEDEQVFMSRDEIERHSPSRRDGIDAFRETHLRYSYCAFIQNLGLRLELPQTTIGTTMVLCHRFFARRSHACHDRFLIATAALFLAAKSEETARPLNNVLRASCEVFHKQDISFLSYILPVDWFEQYRERVIEAEQMILTTLNFELNVQHPYAPLTSILNKLGLSQTVLVNLALRLISEGLRSSLWLQFKPHHIAAGAVYLAAKILNWNLASYQHIWPEFQTAQAIIQDVAQQLMELF